MILKPLITVAKVAITAHRALSAVSAIVFISHGLYKFYRYGARPRQTRKRKM